ncbi:MAG: hypothetical protein KF878_13145 [Planctomycetes bacterium]|nr:hypothetical protein [Planctomycetota bacterium]
MASWLRRLVGAIALMTGAALVPGQPLRANDEGPLPAGARARLGAARTSTSSARVVSVVVVDEGRTLARHDANGLLMLSDAASGVDLAEAEVGAVAVARRGAGEALVVTSGGELLVVDARTARVRERSHLLVDAKVARASFSGDGRRVAVATRAGQMQVFDVERARPVAAPQERVGQVALDPDGALLALLRWGDGQSGAIEVLDVESGRVLRRRRCSLRGGRVGPTLAFSTTGRLAVGWREGRVEVHRLDRHAEPPAEPEDQDADGDRFERELTPGAGRGAIFEVTSLAFARDGARLVVGAETALWEWDLAAAGPAEPSWFAGARADAVVFAPGDAQVHAAWSAGVTTFESPSGAEVRSERGHAGTIGKIRRLPDGRTITAAVDGVRVWDAGGRLVRRVTLPLTVFALDVSAAGDRVVAASGGDLVVCDLDTGEVRPLATVRPNTHLNSVAFAKDDRTVLWGGSDGATDAFWVGTHDPDGARTTRSLGFVGGRFVAAPGSDRVAVIENVERVHVYDGPTWTRVRTLDPDWNCSGPLAFRGDWLAWARGPSYGAAVLHRLDLGSERSSRLDDLTVTAAAIGPDGTVAIALPGGRVEILGERDALVAVGDHGRSVSALEFSPDGRLLISGDHAGSCLVWNLKRAPRWF